MKKLELTKENFRLLAFIISKASSGSFFMKMLKDGGWTPGLTSSQEWQISKKSKEEYLFDEFVKIAEQGRPDIFDYIAEKTIKKDSIYFKKTKGYKFPQAQIKELKKKLKAIDNKTVKRAAILFNQRKLHYSVVFASKRLFSDGHYPQAIFEACKLLNKRVQELTKQSLDGKRLMMKAFCVEKPLIKLNSCKNQSELDEQEGFMFIFAGVMQGIRNPKGHDLIKLDNPVKALEYLGLISLLFRKIDEGTVVLQKAEGVTGKKDR